MEAAILEAPRAPEVTSEPRRMTAEEFWAECKLERAELVDGEVLEKMPPGFDHGEFAGNLYVALKAFVRQHRLGRVSVEGGFRLSPGTVRSPDVSFVTTERLEGQSTQGFIEGEPTLAVEVVSPGDLAGEVEAKVQEYLEAGTLAVWVVYPGTRTVIVRTPDEARTYRSGQALSGEPVLPGFTVALGEIFD